MPTYTYKREDGTTYDLQQKISADALTTCPSTGQAVKRVITGGGGVVYKGDGWYITDYKGNKSADSGASNTNKNANNEESEKVVDANKSSATTGESSSSDTNSNPSST